MIKPAKWVKQTYAAQVQKHSITPGFHKRIPYFAPGDTRYVASSYSMRIICYRFYRINFYFFRNRRTYIDNLIMGVH